MSTGKGREKRSCRVKIPPAIRQAKPDNHKDQKRETIGVTEILLKDPVAAVDVFRQGSMASCGSKPTAFSINSGREYAVHPQSGRHPASIRRTIKKLVTGIVVVIAEPEAKFVQTSVRKSVPGATEKVMLITPLGSYCGFQSAPGERAAARYPGEGEGTGRRLLLFSIRGQHFTTLISPALVVNCSLRGINTGQKTYPYPAYIQ